MGSIKKRPDGKYRARYRDPWNKEHSAHFARKVDAEKWLATQVVKVGAGTWVDPMAGRRRFDEYARAWLLGQIHHRPATTRQVRSRLECQLIPAFGPRPLVGIQRSDVQAWVTKLHRSGLAASTVEGLYRLMAQVMLAAVDDRMIPASPCHKITLPEQVGSKVTIPTAEQVSAIASAASRYGRRLVLANAGMGLRVSEIGGLTTDRVNFLRRSVTIDQQIIGQTGGVPRFGPPKTAASVRTIPVPQSVIDLMAEQLAAWPSSTTVFLTQKGRPWTRASLGEEWRGWCDKAGVGDMKFHALRHFYASALIAAGQSVKVVQERLGHASATTTLDIYGHLWESDDDQTRDVIGDVIATIRGLGAD